MTPIHGNAVPANFPEDSHGKERVSVPLQDLIARLSRLASILDQLPHLMLATVEAYKSFAGKTRLVLYAAFDRQTALPIALYWGILIKAFAWYDSSPRREKRTFTRYLRGPLTPERVRKYTRDSRRLPMYMAFEARRVALNSAHSNSALDLSWIAKILAYYAPDSPGPLAASPDPGPSLFPGISSPLDKILPRLPTLFHELSASESRLRLSLERFSRDPLGLGFIPQLVPHVDICRTRLRWVSPSRAAAFSPLTPTRLRFLRPAPLAADRLLRVDQELQGLLLSFKKHSHALARIRSYVNDALSCIPANPDHLLPDTLIFPREESLPPAISEDSLSCDSLPQDDDVSWKGYSDDLL